MTTISDEAMAHAERVLNQVRQEWLERPGVTAVDLGFKWTQGQMTDQLAIRVHVARKKPLAELSDEERFPDEVDGIPVDVIEAIYGLQLISGQDVQLEAAKDGRHRRFDQVPLGVSIGAPHVTAGTLGAKVFDAATGAEMVLSNWHVLVGKPSIAPGTPVWQPGPVDGGASNADAIAELSRSVLNPHDSAVARITGQRPVLHTTLEGDPIEDVAAPRLGMRVWKSGRTSGRTEGFIDGLKMTVMLNYGQAGVQSIRDVLRIVPRPGAVNAVVSDPGDSGSVWVDEASGKVIGLHFAGEVGDTPEHGLANEIIPVIERLGVLFPAQVPAAEEPEPDPTVTPPAPIKPSPPITPGPVPQPPRSLWQRFTAWLRRLFGS